MGGENIAFYMVLMTAALHLIPGDGYRKYLKFFTGLLLILLVISPLLKVAGMEKTFKEVFQSILMREIAKDRGADRVHKKSARKIIFQKTMAATIHNKTE